jgi:1-phosphofructokinase family hexose kinase
MPALSGLKQTYDLLAVSPNAALDSYYLLSELIVGSVNRAESSLHTAGGKGNNLARAVIALGGRVMSLGIVGGFSGQFIVDQLAEESIPADMVWMEKETRRSSTLILAGQMQTTVVLDSGSSVEPEVGERLIQKIQMYADQAPFLVLTGSLPPELPASYYAEIVSRVKFTPGLNICLDCAGKALRQAVEEGVQVIKVNAKEFQSSFLEGKDWNPAEAFDIFTCLEAKGLKLLVITDGPQGAYVFSSGTAPYRVITKVERWISTAGAGDTFMAGLLLSLKRGLSLEAATCYASAAAAAQLQQVVCGSPRLADLEHFLPATSVEKFFS